jgi:hypothetical protein
MSTDGTEEADFILGGQCLGSLMGGRVWEDAVPQGTVLRVEGDEVLPYAVVHFGTPITERPGRGSSRTLTASENEQPHVMPITVMIYATRSASLRRAFKGVWDRLIGKKPSAGSGEVRSLGGTRITERDSSGAIVRLVRVIYAEVPIGLNG